MRIALALLLGGCAVIKPDYYQSMPTAQICYQLSVYPPWNVNHSARFAELERRGASCGDPAGIAASQRAAGAATIDATKAITATPPVGVCTTQMVGNTATTVCR